MTDAELRRVVQEVSDLVNRQNAVLEEHFLAEVKAVAKAAAQEIKGPLEHRIDQMATGQQELRKDIKRIETKLDRVTQDHETRISNLEAKAQ